MKANPYNSACPSRSVLQLIGGKWSMLIVCLLRQGPMRTGVIRRRIEGISQKMLTQTLRELERHGIVTRIDYGEVPPRVEYKLSRLGRSLSELMQQIEAWLTRHFPRMVTIAQSGGASSQSARRQAPP